MSYSYSKKSFAYYPKRPVKSFQDLEVYQKTLGISVEIIKRITAERSAAEVDADVLESKSQEGQNVKDRNNFCTGTVTAEIAKNLTAIVLEIPKLIATAHSLRFGRPEKAIESLEETMLKCNLAVVYLEQYRDICNVPRDKLSKDKTNSAVEYSIEPEFFEEQIKEYLRVRGRIMRLQRAWLKFMGGRK